MAVTSPASLSKIRTEFGSGSTRLTGFNRGGGYVANHENNGAIATSTGSLRLSQFLNTDKNCEPTYGTNSGFWNGATGENWDSGKPEYIKCQGMASLAADYLIGGSNWGDVKTGMINAGMARNSIDYAGKSYSNTDQVFIDSIFDYVKNETENSALEYAVFAVDGNHTGTWWTTINAGDGGFARADADFPSGQYNNGCTYWIWGGTFGSLGGGFSFEFIL